MKSLRRCRQWQNGGAERGQIRGREAREVCEGQQGDARCAGEVHMFRGFDDREERVEAGRSESMREVTCELQQKNVGTNVQSATRVHLSETCEGRWPSAIGDHAMEGEVEGDDVGARRYCDDSDLWRMWRCRM